MNRAPPVSLLLFVPVQYTKPTQRRGNGLLRPRSRTGSCQPGPEENESKSRSSLLPEAQEGGRIQRWETLRFSPARLVRFHSTRESLRRR